MRHQKGHWLQRDAWGKSRLNQPDYPTPSACSGCTAHNAQQHDIRLALLERRQARSVWVQVLHPARSGQALGHAQLHQAAQGPAPARHRHGRRSTSPVLDDQRLWRTLRRSAKGGGYLFNHKALAKVFRAKLMAALIDEGLTLPAHLPEQWVADCKCVGSGEKVLVYLGRYPPSKARLRR